MTTDNCYSSNSNIYIYKRMASISCKCVRECGRLAKRRRAFVTKQLARACGCTVGCACGCTVGCACVCTCGCACGCTYMYFFLSKALLKIVSIMHENMAPRPEKKLSTDSSKRKWTTHFRYWQASLREVAARIRAPVAANCSCIASVNATTPLPVRAAIEAITDPRDHCPANRPPVAGAGESHAPACPRPP